MPNMAADLCSTDTWMSHLMNFGYCDFIGAATSIAVIQVPHRKRLDLCTLQLGAAGYARPDQLSACWLREYECSFLKASYLWHILSLADNIQYDPSAS